MRQCGCQSLYMTNSATRLVRWLFNTRTSGKNEDVELVLLFRRFHTFRRDLEDGIHVNVNKVNVVLIEDLVERLF